MSEQDNQYCRWKPPISRSRRMDSKSATSSTLPTTSGDFLTKPPYADYCHCHSCCDARHRLVATPELPPGPPPSVMEDEDRDANVSAVRGSEEDEEDPDDPRAQDLAEETEEEEESEAEVPQETRMVRSSYSLLASDPAASRRPIVCPMKPCGRHIAVHTLVSHFRFEHPEVPKVTLSLDQPSATLRVPPLHCLSPLATECAAILRVDWKDDEDKVQPEAWRLVLAYSVMSDGGFVAWVSGMLEGDQEIMAKLEMTTWVSNDGGDYMDVRNLGEYEPYNREGSDDLSTYLVRSAAFLGPVVPLREPQEPLHILTRGDCLYLSPGLVASYSSAPNGVSIQVTIVF